MARRCCAGWTAGGRSGRSWPTRPRRARPAPRRRAAGRRCGPPGCCVDLDAADLLAADAGPAAAARTAAELPAALGRRRGGWRARRAAAVVVEGATRVGRAAGGDARGQRGRPGERPRHRRRPPPADAVVGGLGAADEGRPRSLAAADAVRRASPLTDLRPLPDGSAADLVVLARPWAASDPLVAGRAPRRRAAPGRHRARRHRRGRPAGRPGRDRLPALRRPAPPGRRSRAGPRLAAQLTAARAAAQRRDGHLPADRRHRRGAGAGLPGRRAPRRRRWTRPSSCARPTCSRGCAAGRRTPTAAAGRLPEPPAGPTGHPPGRPRRGSSGRDRAAAGNNGRLTELASSPETTRRRRTGATGAGEEDA